MLTQEINGSDALHGYGEGAIAFRIDRSDEPFAIMLVLSAGQWQFDESAVRLANSLSRQLSIAHREIKLDKRSELAGIFDKLDSMFFSEMTLRPEKSVDTALAYIQESILALFAEDLLRPHQEEALRVQVLFPESLDRLQIVSSTVTSDVDFQVPIEDSVSGFAVAQGKHQVVANVHESQSYRQFLGTDMRSECAIPLFLGEECIAVINLESSMPGRFGGYPAVRVLGFTNRLTNLLAFARLYNDLSEGLERRHANEVFVAMGIEAANILHRVNSQLGLIGTLMRRFIEAADGEAPRELEEIETLIEQATEEPARIRDRLEQLSVVDINAQIALTLSLERYHRYLKAGASPMIAVSYSPDSPNAEVFLFGDMLENLLDNALEACEARMRDECAFPGEVVVSTRVRREPNGAGSLAENKFVVISVEDNGIGLSEHAASSLFSPGGTLAARGESPEERSGLGLGLFLVKKSVIHVGGSLKVDSKPGGGTIAEIQLPLRVVATHGGEVDGS